MWTLPLAGGDWSFEAIESCAAVFDTTSVYDSAHDRVIFVSRSCGTSSYSGQRRDVQSLLDEQLAIFISSRWTIRCAGARSWRAEVGLLAAECRRSTMPKGNACACWTGRTPSP